MTGGLQSAPTRPVRVCYFNTRAGPLEDAGGYLARGAGIDLAPLVTIPRLQIPGTRRS